MRLTWDWTVPGGTQNVHLYFDDVEMPVTGDNGLTQATTGERQRSCRERRRVTERR